MPKGAPEEMQATILRHHVQLLLHWVFVSPSTSLPLHLLFIYSLQEQLVMSKSQCDPESRSRF